MTDNEKLVWTYLHNQRYCIVNEFVNRCKEANIALDEPDTYAIIHYLEKLLKELEEGEINDS